MNRKSLFVTITIAALTLVSMGLKCGGGPPSIPVILSAPETTWINAPTEIRVVSTAPGNKDVRYVIDIGFNNITDTSAAYPSGDSSAKVEPIWPEVGSYQYKIQAVLDEDPAKASDWTAPRSMVVLPNNAPSNLRLQAPMVAVKNVPAKFTVSAEDTDGDSIQFYFDFGDGDKGWVDTVLPTPATLEYWHTFTQIDTFWVRAKARDTKRSECAPESASVIVGTAGGVLWWSAPGAEEPGDSFPLCTSPVIITLLDDTLIYSGCSDDGKFYSIRMRDGRKKNDGSAVDPEFSDFDAHPAYCAATSHIIVGNSDDGRLYAFTANNLTRVWTYPDTSLPNHRWSPAAVNGNKLYAVYSTTITADDSLLCIEDLGGNPSRVAAYRLPADIPEGSAPIVDNQGNVIIGTDAGTLMKFPPNLNSPLWTVQLQATGEIRAPAMDANGTIYCCSDSGRVYAVNSDGAPKWQVTLVPDRETYHAVVGTNGLYVVTDVGKVFLLNLNDGSVLKENQVSNEELSVAPVLASNNKFYCLDYDDVLYCLTADNLDLLWSCNCPEQVGAGFRRYRRLNSSFDAALALGPNGNIIVVGADYTYCVIGYSDGLLATSAWPKWQHDAYNTGKFSGK